MSDLENELENEFEPPPKALASMIDEVRGAGPDIDWERLEAKLFDETGAVREPVRALPPPRKNSRAVAIGVGLALAAAFAVAFISPTRTMEQNQPTAAAVTRAPLVHADGRPVLVGEKIVATDGAWIRSANRIAVHLEPGTIATVIDVGERVHLALETGAVSADVVPVAGGEPFAVDVSGKRVAVHGTRLRVALLTDVVEVAVSEGSAVVGAPRGAGRTEGTIVAAGSVGRFGDSAHVGPNKELATKLVEDSLTNGYKANAPAVIPTAGIGATSEPHPPHTLAVHPAAPKPSTTTTAAMTAPATAQATNEPPPAAPGLTAAQLGAPLTKLDAALGKCARKCPANVVCQYEQTLTLSVDPQGHGTLVSADPGLDSGDRACWTGVLSTIEFPSAAGSTTTKHHVVLGGHPTP